jgi:hypothetical protein
MTMRSGAWQAGIVFILATGCSSRPGAIRPPGVDPEDAAAAAIEKYDRNRDDALSRDEWSQVPELAAVAAGYDSSGDSALSAEEIAEGIRIWQEGPVGARPVPFKITVNGRPLAGATVRLLPADFLGDAVKGASGESGPGGSGKLRLAAEDLPKNAPNMALVQPGLYRVEITHPTVKIAAKYNSQTTLGVEITGSNPGPLGIDWALSQ